MMDYQQALECAKTRLVMRSGWKHRWLIFEKGRYMELRDDGSVRLYVAPPEDIIATDWRNAPGRPDEP